MIVRFRLAFLLVGSLAAVASPAPAATDDGCASCPADGGSDDGCADGCPLCVCGPQRLTMIETPAIPEPLLSSVAEFLVPGDATALASAPHDILHVPRSASVAPRS